MDQSGQQPGDGASGEAAAPPAGRAATLPFVIATVALVGAVVAAVAGLRAGGELAALRAQAAAMGSEQERLRNREERITKAVEVLAAAITALSDEQVDLTSGRLQRLRHGFVVTDLAASPEKAGVLVRGAVANGSALAYKGATFKLSVGDSAQSFVLDALSPGRSGRFELFFPHIAPAAAKQATLSFVSGTTELTP
jgi:hypothetical protein